MTDLILATVLLLLLGGTIAHAHHEARDLRIRRVRLEFDNLPPSFDGYTIVFASDFHVLRPGRYAHRVLDALGGLRGDLLILGGDFQDHRKAPPEGAMAFVDAVAEGVAPFPDGIVAVRGNHDSRVMRAHLKRHPVVRYLKETAMVLERGGSRIALVGARKTPRKKGDRTERAMRRIAQAVPDDVSFRILVAHWPDYYPAAQRESFDLVLSGDTHGGQIRFPFIGPLVSKSRLPRRMVYGPVREGRTTLYTTSGVGTRGLPFRLLCPPEIVVFELHRT